MVIEQEIIVMVRVNAEHYYSVIDSNAAWLRQRLPGPRVEVASKAQAFSREALVRAVI
jgi:hypothetical protein